MPCRGQLALPVTGSGVLGLGVTHENEVSGLALHGATVAAASLPVMPRGPLMIIGGAEDKLRKRTILKSFVAASGGAEARIAVIPTASSLGPEVVEVYDALFRALGAADVLPIRPANRAAAYDPELVARWRAPPASS